MTTHSSVALITGGTSGMGRAVANKLAQLGTHVLVVGRNPERGEKTIAEIRRAGARPISYPLTFATQPAHAMWRNERSNSEMDISIF
jgi:NAD(P)-dependent dehydrogenase (short-subunit alcohol dehydrogenase family)